MGPIPTAYCDLPGLVYQWVKENRVGILGYLVECMVPGITCTWAVSMLISNGAQP